MKVKIKKDFIFRNRYFKKGRIIDVPEGVFQHPVLKEKLEPLNEDRKELFEQAFREHFERLKKIPITISTIKMLFPDVYKKLRELERQADEAYLSSDYNKFTGALKQIEEVMCNVSRQIEQISDSLISHYQTVKKLIKKQNLKEEKGKICVYIKDFPGEQGEIIRHIHFS